MDAKAFFYLVSNMRNAQREYFTTKNQRILGVAKMLEKEVDDEIARVKAIVSKQDQD